MLEDELPFKLSKPAINALKNAGINTLDQLLKASEKELLKLHGLGPKTIRQIQEYKNQEKK